MAAARSRVGHPLVGRAAATNGAFVPAGSFREGCSAAARAAQLVSEADAARRRSGAEAPGARPLSAWRHAGCTSACCDLNGRRSNRRAARIRHVGLGRAA
jgi:hypothetical protein